MDPNISILANNLTRQFGAFVAINNISFSVKKGEVVGFLGPNGAGKSTTMRILSGIMPATSGSAFICGTSVANSPNEIKNKIGYMPENNPLPDDMRVVEYLRFRARLKRVPARKLRQTVQEAMEICDLARTARRKIIGTLSKGFRQRVGIADALLGDPEVIIMDEPTIGLDPHQIQGIRKLIDNLRGKHTVILSSHILPEIERSCDRVIIINRGRLVATGSSEELREEFLPGNRYRLVTNLEGSKLVEQLKTKDFSSELIKTQQNELAQWESLLRFETSGDLGARLIKELSTIEDVKISSVAPVETNLEEIFLAATKRSWEETIDSKSKVSAA